MINFSKASARDLNETWCRLIDGGTGDAWIEFYPGEMPRRGMIGAGRSCLLARLRLNALTMRVDDGQALRSGESGWCRIIGTDGSAIADFTIGDRRATGSCALTRAA
jgi:hypothetical protein